MTNPADAEIIQALANARPAGPVDIRERFGPDVDLAEAMKFLTVLD